MSRDADLLDDVVARLWTVRERLGPDVYRAAAHAALHAIAGAVLNEAERRVGLHHDRGGGSQTERTRSPRIMIDARG